MRWEVPSVVSFVSLMASRIMPVVPPSTMSVVSSRTMSSVRHLDSSDELMARVYAFTHVVPKQKINMRQKLESYNDNEIQQAVENRTSIPDYG